MNKAELSLAARAGLLHYAASAYSRCSIAQKFAADAYYDSSPGLIFDVYIRL